MVPYEAQRKRIECSGASNAETTTLKWFTPFGNQYLGDVVATKSFPNLRVLEDGVVPEQKDDYNCIIGLVAAIGNILCNLLGRSCVSKIKRYIKMFDHSSIHVKKSPEEHVCCTPRGAVQSLPKTGQLVFRTCLHTLKAQWLYFSIVMLSYSMIFCANTGITIMCGSLLCLSQGST